MMAVRSALLAGAQVLGIAWLCTGCGPQKDDVAPAAQPVYQDVIIISIDGLRSDALLSLKPEQLPSLMRLKRGAHTLNARTDPAFTVTLPNHTGMITGRVVEGEQGHQWRWNEPHEDGRTIEENLGEPLDHIFAGALRGEVQPALFATKDKFLLWPDTWNLGEEDQIPYSTIVHKETPEVLRDFDRYLVANADKRDLIFLHIHDCDTRGHADGWNLTKDSAYLDTLQKVDLMLCGILERLDQIAAQGHHTAVIITADHGGGVPYKNHHGQGMQWINYVIPFFAWGTDGQLSGDLYKINAEHREDPSLLMPLPEAWPPPIRNSDAANLSLSLLGLPPLSASTVNAEQELRVQP